MKIILLLISSFIVFNANALNDFDLDVIEEYMFGLNRLPETKNSEWSVNSSKLDIDEFKFLGQTRNTVQWKDLELSLIHI